MRETRLLTIVCGLVLASGTVCHAIAFGLPGVIAEEGDVSASPRLSVAVAATAWNLPKVDISSATGYAGDRVHFEADVAPMVAVEGRLTERIGIGGWVNPLQTDIYLEGPTADLLTSGTSPALPSRRVGKSNLGMWNAHASYRLPGGLTLQAGVLRYHGSLSLRARNPREPGELSINAEMESTEAQLWGYRTWRVWEQVPRPTYLTGGLGVRHRLNEAGSAPGPKTALEASAAFSYFISDTVSLDVSGWFTDLTNQKTLTSRFNAGLTGRF